MPPRQPQTSGLHEIGILISALLSASIALVVMVGMLIYQANTSRRPPHMHKKRAHFLFHALPGSPTKGLCGYMKRKCAHTGAPSLTCRPQFNIGRISRERLVSKMLICLCQLRSGGGGRGATALPIRRRFHQNRPTVLAATSAAAPVACDRGGLAAYDRFTVL